MPQFSVNPNRVDPYKNFKFRVKWDGHYVAGVHHVSGLIRTTESIEHREGGDPSTSHKSPGHTTFNPIRLERGVTHDSAFEDWANTVWRLGAGLGQEAGLSHFRKEVTLELLNEAGQLVHAYHIHRAWVSEYQALPNMDANGEGAVAIEAIVLQNEGWERDTSVAEPQEP